MVILAKHLKLVTYPLIVFVITSSFIHLSVYQKNKASSDFMDDDFDSIYSDIELEINDILENNTWGSPIRITSHDIERERVVLAQDYSGVFHSIWIREYSPNEIALSYSSTTNSSGQEWKTDSVILHTQASISNLNLIIDENNTLHVSYIANKQELSRIYYLNKEDNNSTWCTEQVLYYDINHKLSNLESTISNNKTIHYVWIAEERSYLENFNSSSTLNYFSFIDSIATAQSETLILNCSNPILASISVNKDGYLQLFWMNETITTEQMSLYRTISTNLGESWSENSFILNSGILKTLSITPSILTNTSYIVGIADGNPNHLYFLEYFSNGTIPTTPTLLTEIDSHGYLGGIVENTTNGNVFLIFEERDNARSDLFYRERNNNTNLWEASVQITDDRNSINPFFIRNRNSTDHLGLVCYLGKNELISRRFLNNGNWSTIVNIYRTMKFNKGTSFVIDSKGTAHLVWTHSGVDTHQIYYMKKEFNEQWKFVDSLSAAWWRTATSTTIAIDSNDNLYCFFVAEDNVTEDEGLYYRYLVYGQNNWSMPELIRNPDGDANHVQPSVVIDEDNTIHIVWLEQINLFSNRIVYSSKKTTEQNFTSTNVQENDNFKYSYTPNFVIDASEVIHLVYTDIDQNENQWVFKIQYRTLSKEGFWSDIETIDATNSDYLYKPLLVIDSTEKITLVYLNRYLVQLQRLASDAKTWIKSSPTADWEASNPIVTYEIIDSHNFYIQPDDTLYYVYHSDYFSPDGNPSYIKDTIFLLQKPANENWGEKELLFLNPQLNAEPVAQYDPLTEQLHFILSDKRGTQPQLCWLMKQNDTDNDDFGDYDELLYRSNPNSVDSDLDGLSDGYEMKLSFTNPILNDSDWDGLTDGDEIEVYFTDPLDIDSDRDLLPDGEEILIWETDPNAIDSDNDDIYDFDETYVYHTDPNSFDTDEDLIPDLWEINNDLDPLSDDSYMDRDSDFLSNLDEYLFDADPNNNDTDGDGLSDGREVHTHKTSPTAFDTDKDTLSDSDEILIYGTNPLSEDSDSDGFTDREEINAGTNPNDAKDNIRIMKVREILLVILIPLGIIILIAIFLEVRYRYRLKNTEEDMVLAGEHEKISQQLLEEKL